MTIAAARWSILLGAWALPLCAIPLDSVLARGDSCLAVEWTPDSNNTRSDWYITNGARCTGADSIYRHSDFIAGTPYRSIAYSYGGEDPYHTFREKVDRGFLVGSHLCHYLTFGDPTPAVAGTDCSGFVCYVWNVPRESTAGLAANTRYRQIPKSSIEAGDILVKASSHTVLVVEKDDSTRFLIWESTSAVNGCRERIANVADPEWSAYIALRNPGMARMNHRPQRTTRSRLIVKTVSLERAGNHAIMRLRFIRPWSGAVALYRIDGGTVVRKTIIVPVMHHIVPLPRSLPERALVVSLQGIDGAVETARLVVER